MNVKDILLILAFLTLLTIHGILGLIVYNQSKEYTALLQTAIRFQQACIVAGPACTDRFEGKVAQPKAKQ